MDEIMEVSEDKLFSGLGKFMNDYIQQFDDSDQDIILDLLANYYIAGMISEEIELDAVKCLKVLHIKEKPDLLA